MSWLPELRHHLDGSPSGCGKSLANGHVEALNQRCLLGLPSDRTLSQSGYITVRKMNHPNAGLPQRELVYKVSAKWGILSHKSDSLSRRREYLRRIAVCLAPPQLPLREKGWLGHRESFLLGGYMIYSALIGFSIKFPLWVTGQSQVRTGKKRWQPAQGLATRCHPAGRLSGGQLVNQRSTKLCLHKH